jgi:hypothetical protein
MTAFNPFSGDKSDLRTTRSPRVSRAGASEEENLNYMGASSRFASPEKVQELKEQLQRTARRIKKLEHEAEEGSRALDVANVKLAEKLLLCSTLSAKLLWPDETGFDAANALDALDTLTEDTTCTVDPFVEARRSSSSQWCTAPLKEILPNDPIESLSPSGSLIPRLSLSIKTMGMSSLYSRMADFIFLQHQKRTKGRVVLSWYKLGRDGWRRSRAIKEKLCRGLCRLQSTVLKGWSGACKRTLTLRRSYAKIENTAERNFFQKLFHLWRAQSKSHIHKQRLIRGMKKRSQLRKITTILYAWAADTGCKKVSVQAACDLTGMPEVCPARLKQWLPAVPESHGSAHAENTELVVLLKGIAEELKRLTSDMEDLGPQIKREQEKQHKSAESVTVDSSEADESNKAQMLLLPLGWKQYWSKSKNKPYYRQKGSPITYWQLPENAWTKEGHKSGLKDITKIETPENEPKLADINVTLWGCEYNCGFSGVFDDVSKHEATCDLRAQFLVETPRISSSKFEESSSSDLLIADEYKNLTEKAELLEKEIFVLQTESELSKEQLKVKEMEIDDLKKHAEGLDMTVTHELAEKISLEELLKLAQGELALFRLENDSSKKNALEHREEARLRILNALECAGATPNTVREVEEVMDRRPLTLESALAADLQDAAFLTEKLCLEIKSLSDELAYLKQVNKQLTCPQASLPSSPENERLGQWLPAYLPAVPHGENLNSVYLERLKQWLPGVEFSAAEKSALGDSLKDCQQKLHEANQQLQQLRDVPLLKQLNECRGKLVEAERRIIFLVQELNDCKFNLIEAEKTSQGFQQQLNEWKEADQEQLKKQLNTILDLRKQLEETQIVTNEKKIRTFFKDERWIARLSNCRGKSIMQRAFDGWRNEIWEVQVLDRRLAWKANTFANNLTRPAFQKWCHEMITTHVVREKVESADMKRDTEMLKSTLINWNFAAKCRFLRWQKESKVNERFWMRSLSVTFVHWSHLTYWGAYVHRKRTNRMHRRLGACLKAWVVKTKKQKGTLTKITQRRDMRRRLVRVRYFHLWEYQTRKMRLRKRSIFSCEWLRRRSLLLRIFEPWARNTAQATRMKLEKGQMKPNPIFHVHISKRQSLLHAMDLWKIAAVLQDTLAKPEANEQECAKAVHDKGLSLSALAQGALSCAVFPSLPLLKASPPSSPRKSPSSPAFGFEVERALTKTVPETQGPHVVASASFLGWSEVKEALAMHSTAQGLAVAPKESDAPIPVEIFENTPSPRSMPRVPTALPHRSPPSSTSSRAIVASAAPFSPFPPRPSPRPSLWSSSPSSTLSSVQDISLATPRSLPRSKRPLSPRKSGNQIASSVSSDNANDNESTVGSTLERRSRKSSSSSDDEYAARSQRAFQEEHLRCWGAEWQLNGLNQLHADRLGEKAFRSSVPPQSGAGSTPENKSPTIRIGGRPASGLRSRTSPPPPPPRPVPLERSRAKSGTDRSIGSSAPQDKSTQQEMSLKTPRGTAKNESSGSNLKMKSVKKDLRWDD